MILQADNISSILQSADRIGRHNEEIKRLRGETFNVFSIFKLESRENDGHSAFLAELLNPAGSHLCRHLFLKLFIETIGYGGALDTRSARVQCEMGVGVRNDKLKRGGRIDIYISDAQGHSISIENKIYATDQFNQIERYVNHNRKQNTVYYLTLDGKLATKESKGELLEDQDYYCISYERTILTWLEKCLKEAVEKPILRESIRQYIILIRKLTNQLTDSNMEREIHELILKNYHAAKLIEANVAKVEQEALDHFFSELQLQIERSLGDGWSYKVDKDLTQNWAGLSIEYRGWEGICLRLQGEPRLIGESSIFGIVAHSKTWNRGEIKGRLSSIELFQAGFGESAYWPYYKKLSLFGTPDELERLFDQTKREELLKDMSMKLLELALASKDRLVKIERAK